MRKFIIITLIAFAITNAVSAQVHSDVTKTNTLIFPEFMSGKVLMKSGIEELAELNYDAFTQQVQFLKDDVPMVLTGLNDVDTIYIDRFVFIPADGKVFQMIRGYEEHGPYISYTGKLRPLSASLDKDGLKKDQVGQVNNLAPTQVTRVYRNESVLQLQKIYWIRRGDAFYKANNEKQLLKVLTSRDAASVREFIAKNSISFTNEDNVFDLFDYIATLKPARK